METYVVINSMTLKVVAAFQSKADADDDAQERELKTGTRHIVWEKKS